jgi:hypothetical protein
MNVCEDCGGEVLVEFRFLASPTGGFEMYAECQQCGAASRGEVVDP